MTPTTKVRYYIFVIFLAIFFAPFFAISQSIFTDEQGMIDEGGIMTNKADERGLVQGAFLEQENKAGRREYWLGVGGVILAALLVFEAGIRLASSKSKKEAGT